jgi:hypothetical protein
METLIVDSGTRDDLIEMMQQMGYDSLDLLLTDIMSFVQNRVDEFAAEFGPEATAREEVSEEL